MNGESGWGRGVKTLKKSHPGYQDGFLSKNSEGIKANYQASLDMSLTRIFPRLKYIWSDLRSSLSTSVTV